MMIDPAPARREWETTVRWVKFAALGILVAVPFTLFIALWFAGRYLQAAGEALEDFSGVLERACYAIRAAFWARVEHPDNGGEDEHAAG